MKLKENYVLRQVADVWVVLPLGEATMNLDGMIEISDAILLHRLVNEETITLGAAAYANADCEQDGRLTVADVTLILRKLEEESEGAASGTD